MLPSNIVYAVQNENYILCPLSTSDNTEERQKVQPWINFIRIYLCDYISFGDSFKTKVKRLLSNNPNYYYNELPVHNALWL